MCYLILHQLSPQSLLQDRPLIIHSFFDSFDSDLLRRSRRKIILEKTELHFIINAEYW